MPTTRPHDDDRLHEECGVFGIFGSSDAAAHTALGLHALQHRGQEAAGVVTFDGEQCTYEGPSELSAGEVEIVYHNESSEVIWFDFARLDEGRTTQDIIDYIEDGTVDAPSWTVQVWNQGRISANASSIPTMRTVAPGLHALVCGTWTPYQGYFGSGLTVTP